MPSDRAVFVHIGLPKTGTTYLQHLLWHNRARLADVGVLYPGNTQGAHYAAAMDLRNVEQMHVAGAWQALVDEVVAWPGRVIISHELLAGSSHDQISTVMKAFGSRDVHVITTLRDFSRIVPATWQERAKNLRVESWATFLEGVAKGPRGRHNFWNLQNAPRTLRRWSAAVPGERIHVVTVPPLGGEQDLLLRRFCSVLGLDVAVLQAAPPKANESIGAVEVAVLQRVNRAAKDRLDLETYRRLVKHHVVPDMLASRPGQQRIVLPESCRGWVEKETARVRAAVEALACDVVGDLADLEPVAFGAADARSTSDPDDVAEDDVARASSEVIVDLLEEVSALRRELRVVRRRLRRPPPPSPSMRVLLRARQAWHRLAPGRRTL